MGLTVLNVAYPFAPVGIDSVGGAEQVLHQLDYALASAGENSIVLACAGSEVAGTWIPFKVPCSTLDAASRARAYEEYRSALEQVLRTYRVDVIHMHGVDFDAYLPDTQVPVLVTLHLPLDWYNPGVFRKKKGVYFNCVSASQRKRGPHELEFLPDIPNGIASALFETARERRLFASALGRICPEKGFHLALDAARLASEPMVLAGQVYAYPDHVRYFEREIRPRLNLERRFAGPLGFFKKRRLLASSRCVVIPSLVPETSSLVAMEAMACGAPVVAFPVGALPEIVEHGVTGFLVSDEHSMAAAIQDCADLDTNACRVRAWERFSAGTTNAAYLRLYRELAGKEHFKRMPTRRDAPAIAELCSLQEMESVAPEWQSLWQACPNATPFESPAWILNCVRMLTEAPVGSEAMWKCVIARRNGRLTAVLPLWRTHPHASWSSVGPGISDYRGGCVEKNNPAEAGLVLDHVGDGCHSKETRLDLDNLHATSPWLAAPVAGASSDTQGIQNCCPVLRLPSSMEELLRKLRPGFLKNLMYAERRTAREFQVEFLVASAKNLAEAMQSLFELHARRWSARGRPGVLDAGALQRFHLRVAQDFDTAGLLRLYLLKLDGVPVSAFYGFRSGGTTFFYLCGFDPHYARLSVGAQIIRFAIARAIEEGCARFDFLRGQEPYKYDWGAQDTWSWRRTIVW